MRSVLLCAVLCAGISARLLGESSEEHYKERTASRSRGGRILESSRINSDEEPNGELYALLVAGSNGWYNYRHQADVAHAYHLLLSHGVDPDNIIVMMYDDIAHNKQNPYPGKLFNNPGAKDVYAGLKIDYKGKAVTPANFLAVLAGDKKKVKGGNGRVLESGKQDRVFVYFTDHGATGLISFPDEIMTTKQLNDGLRSASKAGKFDHLVFYLEACESGSMFEDVLAENIDVYAVSAANGIESSFATYCDNKLNLPCLGDLFSVNWMEDSDVEDLDTETLGDQFLLVKKRTNTSHVMHFGDLNLEIDPVGWFQGMDRKPTLKGDRMARKYDNERNSVSSRDVELHHLKRLVARNHDNDITDIYERRIEEIEEQRRWIRRLFKRIATRVTRDETLTEMTNHVMRSMMFELRQPVQYPTCHHVVVHTFHELCIRFNQYDYAMVYAYVLNNLCVIEEGDSSRIVAAMKKECGRAGQQN